VQSYLSANCGDAADDAQSAFISTCKDAGVTVGAFKSMFESGLEIGQKFTDYLPHVATSSSSGSSTGTSSGFTTSVTSAGAHTSTSSLSRLSTDRHDGARRAETS
jgi:hypothetical protein